MQREPQHPARVSRHVAEASAAGDPEDRRRPSLGFLERLQIAAGIATFVVMIVLIALITV
jgi:hypothetical protein